MRQYYLWLNALREIGINKKMELIRKFGDPQQVYINLDKEMTRELVEEGFLKENAAKEIDTARRDDWFKNYENVLEAEEIKYITPLDEEYPERLLMLYDAPLVLFYKGDISLLKDAYTVGVIGSRRPTGYGRIIAKGLVGKMAERGITVISGMAAGIDSVAHKATLDAAGRTIAVLGSGVNHCYPRENFPLYENIIECGLVISEFGPEVPPLGINFPLRNRIISGLSEGVLVIEAALRSGTLITVDAALEQGRLVYAVPGRVGDPLSEGTNNLIRNGAILVTKAEDIVEDLIGHTEESFVNQGKKNVNDTSDPMTDKEKKIYDCLSLMPVYIDDLIRKTGETVTVVISNLYSMEKKGYITQETTGYYARKM